MRRKALDMQELILFKLHSSYETTLEAFGIKEMQFFNACTQFLGQLEFAHNSLLEDAIIHALADYKPPYWKAGSETLDKIAEIVFRIEDEYLQRAFLQARKGERRNMPYGYFINPFNLETVVAFGLETSLPGLSCADRDLVVTRLDEAIVKSSSKAEFLRSIGLNTALRVMGGSPYRLLIAYDSYIQRTRGFSSIFQLNNPSHLHPWEMCASNYFQPVENVEAMVAHVLEEQIPGLKRASREDAVNLLFRHFMRAKNGSSSYVYSIGLGSLMQYALDGRLNSSPFEVLRVYDSYLKKTNGFASLMDLNEQHHIHEWEAMQKGYQQQPLNVEKAVSHLLEEEIPVLKHATRDEVIRLLLEKVVHRGSSSRLREILPSLEGAGIGSSPIRAFTVYDAYLQRTRQFDSIFDLTQEVHIHPWDITPKYFFQDRKNTMIMAAHVLEEKVQGLKGAGRDEAVRTLGCTVLASNSHRFLNSVRLYSLMAYGLNGSLNNTYSVLSLYDEQMAAGNPSWKSIFDQSCPIYVAVKELSDGKHILSVIEK